MWASELERLNATRWAALSAAEPSVVEDTVRALYVAILEREPDPDGLAHHARRLAAGLPLERLMAEMARSRDRELADRRISTGMPSPQAAARLIKSLLAVWQGRPLNPEEADAIRGRLEAGDPWWIIAVDAMDRAAPAGEPGRQLAGELAELKTLVTAQRTTIRALTRRLAALEDLLAAGEARSAAAQAPRDQ
jgi:hypothetical protein